jgi:hypothetical protein
MHTCRDCGFHIPLQDYRGAPIPQGPCPRCGAHDPFRKGKDFVVAAAVLIALMLVIFVLTPRWIPL